MKITSRTPHDEDLINKIDAFLEMRISMEMDLIRADLREAITINDALMLENIQLSNKLQQNGLI